MQSYDEMLAEVNEKLKAIASLANEVERELHLKDLAKTYDKIGIKVLRKILGELLKKAVAGKSAKSSNGGIWLNPEAPREEIDRKSVV